MTIKLQEQIKWTAEPLTPEAGCWDAADFGMHLLSDDMLGSDEEFLEAALLEDAEEDADEDWDFEAFRTGGNSRLAAVRGRIFAHG